MLRNKTTEFRQRIKEHLSAIDEKIIAKKEEAEKLPIDDIGGRDIIYQEIDLLKKERNKEIEDILNEILPEAFAVVKRSQSPI
ncbi:MAG: hypothetical protein WDM71_03490 [Ferruginibacter sp.]